MFKSLYFKIVLILLIFIIAVMCAVSAILINGVSGYFRISLAVRWKSALMKVLFCTMNCSKQPAEATIAQI